MHSLQLSLAGWSLQSLFRAPADPLKLIDFPAFTRDTFGITAIELNNIFFDSTRTADLDALRAAADAAGVTMLNIAIDEHGDLASTDPAARAIALANYARWISVAAYLGVAAVRANSGGANAVDLQAAAECCVDSFRRLCDVGRRHGVQILIENHWGLSYDPDFIVRLIAAVRLTHGHAAIAALADFGNWPDAIDRESALARIMPLASAVHAKVNEIDAALHHPRFDHARCIAIARAAGYEGFLGIEYEGHTVDCIEGVLRGVRLLREVLSVKA